MYFACQSANQTEKLYLRPKSGLFMDEIWCSSSLFKRFISFVVCFGLCKLGSFVTSISSFSTWMAAQLQRGRQICHIKDVTPRSQNWKVLIQVLERKKSGTSRSLTNPTQYRGYLFVDTMGTLVSAVCYGTDVAYLETTLLPYKRYYISNVFVKVVNPGYQIGDYGFSWTVYSTSMVQPLDETVPPCIPYDFQFKRFSEMFRCADLETPMNIKGLIVQTFPEKKVGQDVYGRDLIAKDFVVVDTESAPIIMRLWKEKINEYGDCLSEGLPEAILFVALNIKATTFNGLSLSSRLNSVFLKDALIPEASALKEWYALKKKDVDHLVSMLAYYDMDLLLPKPAAADVIPVADAMSRLETIKTAWIAGKLKLLPGQDKFWYMACKNCQKALRPGQQEEGRCTSCDAPDPINIKCHIGVTIADDSGTAYAEIYSPDAEKLIPFTALQLKEAEEQGRLVVNELEAALENKHVVCYIKYFDKLVRGAVTRKYPLVKIYRYEDVFPTALQVSADSIRETTGTSMLSEKATVDLTRDDEDNVQFFTPSTKNLIAEIYASSQATVTDSASPAGCKRVLSFTDVPRATAIVKIEPIEDATLMKPMTESSSSVESPVKKSKGKLKQN